MGSQIGRSRPMQFQLTKEHVTLLRHMSVGWVSDEYGAPEIDPKRPYGNSDVERDIGELLGWVSDNDTRMTREQRERAAVLHREMEVALQVVLHAGAFEPGIYRNIHRHAPYGVRYVRATPTAPEGAKEASDG